MDVSFSLKVMARGILVEAMLCPPTGFLLFNGLIFWTGQLLQFLLTLVLSLFVERRLLHVYGLFNHLMSLHVALLLIRFNNHFISKTPIAALSLSSITP